jgi:steroid delta-isomerase-like uncharacterized protein
MSQQNESIVRRLMNEAWNEGNLETVDDCVAPQYTHEGPLDSVQGPQGLKEMITKYRTAFPDCNLKIDDMFSADDRVVVRFQYSGTHKAALEGLAPTGRHASGAGIDVHRVENGRIVETYSQWDALGLMQQLGVVTLPGRARAAGM